MKSKILITAAIFGAIAGPARALTPIVTSGTCTTMSAPSGINMCQTVLHEATCSTSNSRYYSSTTGTCYNVTDCLSCPAGYTRTQTKVSACSNNITYYDCKCVCSGGCESDTSWSASGTGYEKKTNRNCECYTGSAICNASTSYRCAIGYYGSSSNGTSGCTRCPSSGGVYGTTDSAGTTSITGCYLPDGTKGSDGTGSWEISGGKCYYK